MRQISIAIPTYNRVQMLFESFEKVIDNDLIAEVVIVDDASSSQVYYQIEERAKKNPKIQLQRNDENLDCYQNKCAAIFCANNDWCILLDSDNQIDFDYLYRISQIPIWKEDTAYLPSFAKPFFDYRKYEGIEITKHNVAEYMDDSTFTTCLNTCNYFVNRKFYLQCWDGNVNPHTSDSIYMNYLYLKNGGKLFVVPSLHYQHRVDNHGGEESGHYQRNCHKTGDFHQEVIQKLKALR
jgi:glycosyltransferase involved in cell wall biosynthesis